MGASPECMRRASAGQSTGASASACDVLAFVGPGDGIGNSLTQTPTEFLMADCEELTGIDQKLACAELATRS